jgi:ribonuclease Z
MTKLIFLGTSNAIPDESHDNTHLAIIGEKRRVLIDCGNNPIIRLKQAGLDLCDLTDLVLSHFHPDHVGSVPLLLMDSWLKGRTKPLEIYGFTITLDLISKMLDFYQWRSWPNFYPVRFHNVTEREMAPVLENPEFQIYASPVRHLVPTMGLRIEFSKTGKSLAFSCDTEPCEAVVKLGREAEVLIHESTGASFGHTSAAQAGEIAQKAEAKSLYLIHYPTGDFDCKTLIDEARQNFRGSVYLAEDFMELEL